jgi:4'-phosphopantetheinyl transferase
VRRDSEKVKPLNDTAIHVYFVPFTAASIEHQYEPFWALLDEQERSRASRFHFNKHRKRFVMAHGHCRMMLARYLSLAPADIVFKRGEHGKPAIENLSEPLYFNLSHSHQAMALAVCRSGNVGIDLEYTLSERHTDLLAIAEHSFAPDEVAALKTLSGEDLKKSFYQIWTQKEAFIKLSGRGLAFGLDRFSVSHQGPGKVLRLDETENPSGFFSDMFRMDSGYVGCVMSGADVQSVEYIAYSELRR